MSSIPTAVDPSAGAHGAASAGAAAPATPGRQARRSPRPQPPSAPPRPALRVVPHRRRSTATVVVGATAATFAVLLATAAVHTTIVSGQREIDQLDSRIEAGEQRNQALRLRVAQMEAPERIVKAGFADGMVIPDEVIWLTPGPDGQADASVASRATAPEPPPPADNVTVPELPPPADSVTVPEPPPPADSATDAPTDPAIDERADAPGGPGVDGDPSSGGVGDGAGG